MDWLGLGLAGPRPGVVNGAHPTSEPEQPSFTEDDRVSKYSWDDDRMSDAKIIARRYINEGWQVLPIPRGEKGPRASNWQTRVFSEEDFQVDDNIGVRLGEPSKGLTDIDLDCKEAIEIAPKLLLATNRIHGRPSKPRSHYWYIAPGAKSKQFKDTDGTVLVELRSTGGQTVLPPSVHPSGEIIQWVIDREINTVDPEGLYHSTRLVATATILARHWPKGARHATTLLIAGLLASFKLISAEVQAIIEAAATVAGDEEIFDRVRAAADTVKKFEAGQPVGGGPKLAEAIGADVVKIIRSWYLGASGSKVDELNERHAVVFQQSGDIVVITEDLDIDGRPFLRFSSPGTIESLYPQKVQVGTTPRGQPIFKPLGKLWLESPTRRFYNGIELAPNGRATPGYYNMWRDFAVKPKKGSWERFQKHVYEVICTKNDTIFEYVISWMAKAVQKPGQQANTAIALRGGQGTGKGAFVRGFGALFGVHFIHLDSTRHLTGNFNAHLHNAIMVFADEAAWPGDKAGLGALKRLITEPTLSIERKGMDIFTVPNMIHLMLASNEDWSVPAAIDERRFVVLDVDKSRQQDTAYFAALEDELFVNEGLAAMLHDLLDFNIKIDLRQIPKTEALFQQKQITNSAQRRWWYQILYDGEFWTTEVPGAPGKFRIDRQKLYDNYVQTLDRAGHRVKSIQTELGQFLKKVMPDPYPETFRSRDGDGNWAPREWIFPSLAVCRNFYDEEYGAAGLTKWPEEDPLPEEPPQQLRM